MPLLHVRVICLCCQGPFFKSKHNCPIGLCTDMVHFDFCGVCVKLIMDHFKRQVSGTKKE